MTSELPYEVSAALERIQAPSALAREIPSDVTGELRRLLSWWFGVGGSAEPHPVIVEDDPAEWPTSADAMTAGVEAADRAVDEGATVLVPRVLHRNDVSARTVIAVLTRADSPALVPQPEGVSDAQWMTTVTAVRDKSFRAAEHRGEPVPLLDAAEARSVAFIVGVLLGSSARETPCLIDGTDELAAALVADRIHMTAKAWWRCGSQSTDPARTAACERADLDAGLPLGLTDDDGLGAEASLALLRLLTS